MGLCLYLNYNSTLFSLFLASCVCVCLEKAVTLLSFLLYPFPLLARKIISWTYLIQTDFSRKFFWIIHSRTQVWRKTERLQKRCNMYNVQIVSTHMKIGRLKNIALKSLFSLGSLPRKHETHAPFDLFWCIKIGNDADSKENDGSVCVCEKGRKNEINQNLTACIFTDIKLNETSEREKTHTHISNEESIGSHKGGCKIKLIANRKVLRLLCSFCSLSLCVNNQNSWNGAARTHCVWKPQSTAMGHDSEWNSWANIEKMVCDESFVGWLNERARERESRVLITCALLCWLRFKRGYPRNTVGKRGYCYAFFFSVVVVSLAKWKMNKIKTHLSGLFAQFVFRLFHKSFTEEILLNGFNWFFLVCGRRLAFFLSQSLFTRTQCSCVCVCVSFTRCALFEEEWRNYKSRKN